MTATQALIVPFASRHAPDVLRVIHLIPKWTDTDGLAVDHRAAGYIDQRDISRRLRERLR